MADETEFTKRILTALTTTSSSTSGEINVKKLRKQILLQLQTDSDDKAAKKSFKKAIQGLEAKGRLTLDKEGTIRIRLADGGSGGGSDKSDGKGNEKKKLKKEKKVKKAKTKKEKSKSKSKTKRKKSPEDDDDDDADGDGVDQEEQQPLEKKIKLGHEDNHDEEGKEEDDGTEAEETPTTPTPAPASDLDPAEKNKPCTGNPSGYTRLFLGNLPFAVDGDSLGTFLSPAVVTHIKWITDKETGKFYGSAFIEMDHSESAAIAVKQKNGLKLMGRPIRINYAPARSGDIWPPKGSEQTGNGGQAGGTGVKAMSVKPDNCVKLFVGNLSFDIDDDTIIKFFANVDAEVKAVRWLHHRDTGDFKGCGYVEFWKTEACEKGATLNGKSLMGRPIRIDWTD